tara:strand:+ start:121 stop:735 length:615 start_codon:yes stop_codon:yes gene_type:complete
MIFQLKFNLIVNDLIILPIFYYMSGAGESCGAGKNRVQQFIDAQTRYDSNNIQQIVNAILSNATRLSNKELVEEISQAYSQICNGLTVCKNMVVVNDLDCIEDFLFNIVAYAIALNVTLSGGVLDIEQVKTQGLNLFIKKNRDYGDAFAVFGIVGVLVRMGDKISRLVTLVGSNNGHFESIKDTAIDLYNYALMVSLLINDNQL